MNKIDKQKTENLAAGGKFRLDEIPVKKFFEQAQYIENTLLPAIERKTGKGSADYKFFQDVYKSMLFSASIVDRFNNVVLRLQQEKQLTTFHQQRADLAERELLKYTTMEELILTDGLEHIARGVVQRINDLLINK